MLKHWKQILWTACVLFLCIIDQRIGSCTGESQLIFSSCVALVVGIFILTHYSLRSYLLPHCAVWAVLCAIAAPAAMIWGNTHALYPGRFHTIVCILVLYGFLFIRTALALIKEKKKTGMKPWLLGIFALLFLFFALSRYNDKWPLMYLAAFFLFYLTGFTQEEKQIFLYSIQDGIIAGFFVIQGLAFVFRPYDTLRYMGMYANTNMNALFYQAVYCAFLSKFCIMEIRPRESDSKTPVFLTIIKWLCFAFAAAMWSFVFLTMCRSALLGMGTATVLAGIYCLKHTAKKRLQKGFRYVLLLAVITAAGFPAVYGAVRYLPPVFHHPVWFYNDYSEERVHSNDPWDSPKFTAWQDVLKENLGRFWDLLPSSLRNGGEDSVSGVLPDSQESMARKNTSAAEPDSNLTPEDTSAAEPDSSPATEDASTAELGSISPEDAFSEDSQENSSGDAPSASAEDSPSPELKSTSARLTIYRHYLSSLNLTGHLEQENGLQVSDDYYAPHAHNLFLQYAFNYGLPAGILFFLWIAAALIKLFMDVFRSRKPSSSITALLLFAAAVVFGLTEIMWRNGLLSNTLIFLLPYFAWPRESED